MMINEFLAKKIGEVIAFTRVGIDTLERAHAPLVSVLGEEKVQDILDRNRFHGEELLRITTDGGAVDTTLQKASKTEEKLKAMRDLYIKDEWDNPTEILEWSGFFEGAAIVHAGLIKGGAEALGNESLMTLCEEFVQYHYEILEMVEGELALVGQDRATV